MAITLQWLEAERILIGEYSGTATFDDYSQASDRIMELAAEGPVATLGDLSRVESFAPDYINMPHVINLMRTPNLVGSAIIIDNKSFMRHFATLLGGGFGLKLCTTREEGMAYLRMKLAQAAVR
jgi:hypothetical protein